MYIFALDCTIIKLTNYDIGVSISADLDWLHNCIKNNAFSVRAWRGHDCVLMGLKTLFLANFQRVERLKQEKDI